MIARPMRLPAPGCPRRFAGLGGRAPQCRANALRKMKALA